MKIQPDRENVLTKVAAIYRELSEIPIQRACINRTECCQFHLTGKAPLLTAGEGIFLAQGVRAAGWKQLPVRDDGVCPLLSSQGKCRAYAARPFGCRTHFCQSAGGPYARKEVLPLIRRLEELDAQLGGSGPQSLDHSVGEALGKW